MADDQAAGQQDEAETDSQAQGTRRGSGKSESAFRTISEVANELDLPQHVLRFWETRFDEVSPMKRGGGRRYYRPEDVTLLRGIRDLLYTDGFTIKGVQKLLRESGTQVALDRARTGEPAGGALPANGSNGGGTKTEDDGNPPLDAGTRDTLKGVLDELLSLRQMLDEVRTGDKRA